MAYDDNSRYGEDKTFLCLLAKWFLLLFVLLSIMVVFMAGYLFMKVILFIIMAAM